MGALGGLARLGDAVNALMLTMSAAVANVARRGGGARRGAGNPWVSLDFPGFYRGRGGIPGFHKGRGGIPGFPWISLDFIGDVGESLDFTRDAEESLGFLGFPWIS